MSNISPIGFGTFLPIINANNNSSVADAELKRTVTNHDAGNGFGNIITKALDAVSETQSTANSAAVQAATGNLSDIHDYTIAAQQASLTLDVTLAVRNKALDAYQEIMRMQV